MWKQHAPQNYKKKINYQTKLVPYTTFKGYNDYTDDYIPYDLYDYEPIKLIPTKNNFVPLMDHYISHGSNSYQPYILGDSYKKPVKSYNSRIKESGDNRGPVLFPKTTDENKPATEPDGTPLEQSRSPAYKLYGRYTRSPLPRAVYIKSS